MVMAMDKMKLYSTDCGFRRQLRSMKVSNCPVKVVHDLKDLGAYFAAVSRQTAKNYKERFQKCQIRFQKLAVVAWPDNRRAATLMRVILPAVLYGSELTHFSFSTYKQLRGRCSSSLWGARNARDHDLAPLLSASCMYEPFLLFSRDDGSLCNGYFGAEPDVLLDCGILFSRSMLRIHLCWVPSRISFTNCIVWVGQFFLTLLLLISRELLGVC